MRVVALLLALSVAAPAAAEVTFPITLTDYWPNLEAMAQGQHLREVTVQVPQVADLDVKNYEIEIRAGAAVVATGTASHVKGAATTTATITISAGVAPYGTTLTARARAVGTTPATSGHSRGIQRRGC